MQVGSYKGSTSCYLSSCQSILRMFKLVNCVRILILAQNTQQCLHETGHNILLHWWSGNLIVKEELY